MARDFEILNVKLYEEDDSDIINFLEDKPKAYFVKRALRVYMNVFEKGTPGKETKEEKPGKIDTGDDYDELEGLT